MKNKILKFVNRTAFYNSFRQMNLHLLSNCLFDLLYIFFILLILAGGSLGFYYANDGISGLMSEVSGIMTSMNTPDGLGENAESSIDALASGLKGFLFKAGFLILLGFVLFILNASLFKSIIWRRIKDNKINFKDLWSQFRFSILWYLFWVVLTLLFWFLFNMKILPYIYVLEIVLFIYLTSVFRSLFSSKKGILDNFKEIFVFSFKKSYLFIIPILLMFVVFYLINLLIGLMGYVLPVTVFGIVYTIFVLIFITWCRFYFVLCVKEIKKR